MSYIVKEKIKIGISACNFGTPVRYNMKGWNRVAQLDREKSSFIWVPVCPEINAGMGTPRETIKLVNGNGDDFWDGNARVKSRSGQDVSEQIRHGALSSFDLIKSSGCEAFVFQEGSPTCGVYRTTLKNKRLGKPPGVFGSLLMKEEIFLIPAEDLDSPIKWWDWRRRLHAFVWLKRKNIESKQELYDIWHNFKFLCQEVNIEHARKIGEKIAKMKGFDPQIIAEWKTETLRLLRQPSTFRKIVGIMTKHWGHYNKHFDGKTEKIPSIDDEVGKAKFVEQINEMEKRAFLEGYGFAGTPVIFRGER